MNFLIYSSGPQKGSSEILLIMASCSRYDCPLYLPLKLDILMKHKRMLNLEAKIEWQSSPGIDVLILKIRKGLLSIQPDMR